MNGREFGAERSNLAHKPDIPRRAGIKALYLPNLAFCLPKNAIR
jgi:hypothetical protein